METATESRTYFSTARSMTIHPNIGKGVMQDGQRAPREGEKIIEFSEFGEYGRLITDDPEVIEWLDKQIARGRPEFFGPEEYKQRITPDHVKLAELNSKVGSQDEMIRQLTEQNRLLRDEEARKRNGAK